MKTNRATAWLLVIGVVLVTNPEWVAGLFTLQAIGVETFVLLSALQVRSAVDALRSLAIDRRALAAPWAKRLRRAAGLALHLCPRPEHPLVLRHLAWWFVHRRIRSVC